jgi:heterodisulfide reductase subunit B
MLPIMALNARNLTLASRSGQPNIICNCPTCYSNLKYCKEVLAGKSAMRDRAMEAVRKAGIEYHDSVTISHVSEAFLENLDKIKAKAVYSMEGIRAVTHHGCHYSKIYHRDVMAGNCERPMVLDEIAKGLGCETLDYPERSLCCGLGFHHIMLYPDYTRNVQKRKYSGIIDADPDVIITMCAGCTLSLDLCQEKIMQELGLSMDIPVLNISEMMALVLGADPYMVGGFEMHAVPVEPLLDKMIAASGVR